MNDSTESQDKSQQGPVKKSPAKPSPFVDLLWNVVAPTLVLTKLSSPDRLGPIVSLIIAVILPLGYGSYDMVKRRKLNFFSVLGLVNVLLTGGFGLAELDRFWFAVKEASVPTLFGLAILASLKWTKAGKETLLEKMFLNDSLFQIELIRNRLKEHASEVTYKKVIRRTTFLFAFSFAVSAVLNFVLAIWILESPPGTSEFAAELGKMNALSFPVIALSCTSILIGSLFWFIHDLKKMTGLDWDDIMVSQTKALKH